MLIMHPSNQKGPECGLTRGTKCYVGIYGYMNEGKTFSVGTYMYILHNGWWLNFVSAAVSILSIQLIRFSDK